MNAHFLKGLGVGLLIPLALFSVRIFGAGSARDAGTTLAPATTPSSEPAPAALQSDLAAARKETADAREQYQQAKARVDQLEGALQAADHENKQAPAKPGENAPTDEAKKKAAAERAEAVALSKVQIGKPLSDEAAAALGLDPGQRQIVDTAMVEEGQRIYAQIRALGVEGGAAVPPEDGFGLFMAVLGKTLEKDATKLQEMFSNPESRNEEKYLEDFMGADSMMVRITELSRNCRQETMTALAPTLTPDQREKFARYLATSLNFGGASLSFPSNIKIRRAK